MLAGETRRSHDGLFYNGDLAAGELYSTRACRKCGWTAVLESEARTGDEPCASVITEFCALWHPSPANQRCAAAQCMCVTAGLKPGPCLCCAQICHAWQQGKSGNLLRGAWASGSASQLRNPATGFAPGQKSWDLTDRRLLRAQCSPFPWRLPLGINSLVISKSQSRNAWLAWQCRFRADSSFGSWILAHCCATLIALYPCCPPHTIRLGLRKGCHNAARKIEKNNPCPCTANADLLFVSDHALVRSVELSSLLCV